MTYVPKIAQDDNGEEYDFFKTLSFARAQKTMENPTNRTPIWSSDR